MASHIDRREFMATVSGVAVAWPLAAHAQTDFPNRYIHMVVPYPTGGIVDIATRIVTDKLSESPGRWADCNGDTFARHRAYGVF